MKESDLNRMYRDMERKIILDKMAEITKAMSHGRAFIKDLIELDVNSEVCEFYRVSLYSMETLLGIYSERLKELK